MSKAKEYWKRKTYSYIKKFTIALWNLQCRTNLFFMPTFGSPCTLELAYEWISLSKSKLDILYLFFPPCHWLELIQIPDKSTRRTSYKGWTHKKWMPQSVDFRVSKLAMWLEEKGFAELINIWWKSFDVNG